MYGRFWRKAVVDVQMLDLVGCRTGTYRISGGPAPESMRQMPDHPSWHIRQRHWVLRGCGSSSKEKGKEKRSAQQKEIERERASRIRRTLCLPAKHPYSAQSSLAIGCQATTNSAGIVLGDRSFAERSFGFSTPGLLMKRGSAKIRLG
jgi:hypothetical protein